ncbi:uncharacterized protein [Physcomitrium patens]|uniref:uncharacterized protein isoform X2 n=1 Tax=Physcomitrium patens TaxID=3218 RepID=UPI003CCD8488
MSTWDYDENGDPIDETHQYRELNASGSSNYNTGYRSSHRNHSDHHHEHSEDHQMHGNNHGQVIAEHSHTGSPEWESHVETQQHVHGDSGDAQQQNVAGHRESYRRSNRTRGEALYGVTPPPPRSPPHLARDSVQDHHHHHHDVHGGGRGGGGGYRDWQSKPGVGSSHHPHAVAAAPPPHLPSQWRRRAVQEGSAARGDLFSSSTNVVNLTFDEVNALAQSHRSKAWLVVVYAPWCHFCQAMESNFERVAHHLESSNVLEDFEEMVITRNMQSNICSLSTSPQFSSSQKTVLAL